MRGRRIFIFGLFVVGLFALAAFARARVPQAPLMAPDHVGIQQSYTLTDTVDDSLFIVAQDIDLQSGSRVTGDAAFIGSTLNVDGRIDGDLTATGSTLTLGPDARIGGDLVLIGSTVAVNGRVDGDLTVSGTALTIAPGAQVNGDFAACVDNLTDNRTSPTTIGPCSDLSHVGAIQLPQVLGVNVFGGPPGPGLGLGQLILLTVLKVVFVSLLLSGLAAIAITLFPGQIGLMEEAIRTTPRSQIVNGLMVFLLLIGLGSGFVVLLAIVPALGILLVPIVLILALLLFGVLLAGLVTLTMVFGGWLLGHRTRAKYPPLVEAAVGSAALTILLLLPAFIPYGGFFSAVALALLAAMAIGTALSTRMGTRSLRPRYFVQG